MSFWRRLFGLRMVADEQNGSLTKVKVIAWIFQATAMASAQSPTKFAGISMLADGIMHAVPTHRELQMALTYLTSAGYVEKNANRYSLTPRGRDLSSRSKSPTIAGQQHILLNWFAAELAST